MKKTILSTVAFCLLIGSTGRSVEPKKPGLVGAWFGEADLTDCRDAVLIKSLEQKWDESDDRGKNWQGPYQLADFGTDRLTSRTDCIINGKNNCMFFLSAKEERVQAGLQDRAFCARTTDGGKTFKFLSWMTHNIEVRSVMPSTVRISENQLVSAMRRRYDPRRPGSPDTKRNWIDVYRSDDNGKTWGPEIRLRDDGRTWDLGYTRTVQRLDDKLVTIYCYTTEKNEEQHIAATIWEGSQNAKNSVLGPGPRPR